MAVRKPKIEYTVVRTDRKSLSVRITPDAIVEVRAPLKASDRDIAAFVERHRDWIEPALARVKAKKPSRKLTQEELDDLGRKAKDYFAKWVAYWAPKMGVTNGKITIRTQHTRWGSCSSKGNLNFNRLLMLAPEGVRQYVVIHELCHRFEMNHSAKFYAHVAKYMPNYKSAENWLKVNGTTLQGLID